jgi:hypothetical protein
MVCLPFSVIDNDNDNDNDNDLASYVSNVKNALTVTSHTVELAWADHGFTAVRLRQDAQAYGFRTQWTSKPLPDIDSFYLGC